MSPRTPRNLALALSEKSGDFSRILALTEVMVGFLRVDQVDDDDKKAYCAQRLTKTQDQAKVLAHQITGHKDGIEDYEERLPNTDARVTAVQQLISQLDGSVAKTTEVSQGQPTTRPPCSCPCLP